jgi:hypothetical protein
VLGEQVLEFQKTQDAMCRDMDYFETQMEKARADRDALGEQRDAALALHRPRHDYGDGAVCATCSPLTPYPCRTARALGVTDV